MRIPMGSLLPSLLRNNDILCFGSPSDMIPNVSANGAAEKSHAHEAKKAPIPDAIRGYAG